MHDYMPYVHTRGSVADGVHISVQCYLCLEHLVSKLGNYSNGAHVSLVNHAAMD